jgi:hypothetical protein
LAPYARWVGRFLVLAALTAFAAAFSDWPAYQQIPQDAAVVKLSFTHGADRSAHCRRRTADELAKLPPNMRRPTECPRARPALDVELSIDGHAIYAASLPPSGLSRDGPSQVYKRFTVPAGEHVVVARLRDTPRQDGFDHERTATVTLQPGQSLAIDFRPELGGFVFR